MSAASVADAFEQAIRTGDIASLRPLLHPRVQGSGIDNSAHRGVDEVMAWLETDLGAPEVTVTVVERYIDEPVAVIVVLTTVAGDAAVEYTVALITLDDALLRIVVDA